MPHSHSSTCGLHDCVRRRYTVFVKLWWILPCRDCHLDFLLDIFGIQKVFLWESFSILNRDWFICALTKVQTVLNRFFKKRTEQNIAILILLSHFVLQWMFLRAGVFLKVNILKSWLQKSHWTISPLLTRKKRAREGDTPISPSSWTFKRVFWLAFGQQRPRYTAHESTWQMFVFEPSLIIEQQID